MDSYNPLENPLINPTIGGGFAPHPVERLMSLIPYRTTSPANKTGVGSNPSLPAWQIFINSPARL